MADTSQDRLSSFGLCRVKRVRPTQNKEGIGINFVGSKGLIMIEGLRKLKLLRALRLIHESSSLENVTFLSSSVLER